MRGKGFAAGLLGHALLASQAAGFDRATLAVDSANATPAVGVYERCGFRVADEWHAYLRPA